MIVYAESSAVLAWLLDQEHGEEVKETLSASESVIASALTLIECDRVLVRAAALGELTESDAAQRKEHLRHVSEHWTILTLDQEVVERARDPFPEEPIRTLDALHLASALTARQAIQDVVMLSLDHRIRAAAEHLGFALMPAEAEAQSRA